MKLKAFVLLQLLMWGFLLFGCSKVKEVPMEFPSNIEVIKRYFLADEEVLVTKVSNVKVTCYSEDKKTDKAFRSVKSGRVLYEGSVAISEEFIEKGIVGLGDIVYVEKLAGFFTVEDTVEKMNSISVFTFKTDGFLAYQAQGESNIYIIKMRG